MHVEVQKQIRLEIVYKHKLESTGYSAVPSPWRLMQHCGVQSWLGGQTETDRQTDANNHNTFSG